MIANLRERLLAKYITVFQECTVLQYGFIFIFSIIFLLTLNAPVIKAWFLIDDTAVLLCSQYSAWDLLFDRATNNFCNPLFFTPLWPISFKPDVWFFGLQPVGYHVSNLLVASLCGLLFFNLVRRYVSFWPALIATLLLISSMPFAFGIGWITRKHYLLGLLFTLASIYLLNKFVDTNRKYWFAVALVFYLAALLCKEAYAFLPALVFFLIPGSLQKRIAATIPFFSILGGYLLWRYLMYGGLGGYPATKTGLDDIINRLLTQWISATQEHYGSFAFFIVPPILLLILRRPQQAWTAIAILIITLSPYALYPDSGFHYANKLLASAAAASLIYALALETSRQSRWFYAFILVSTLGLLVGSVTKSQDAHSYVRRASAHFKMTYSYAFDPSVRQVLVIGEFPYFYTALSQLKNELGYHDFPQVTAISDQLALPFFKDRHFDRIILSRFSPSDPSPSVIALNGNDVSIYLEKQLQSIYKKSSLSIPEVEMEKTRRNFRFSINDQRDGVWIRCLYRSDFGNCVPVKRVYTLPYPQLAAINRVDIFLYTQDHYSLPTSFSLSPSTMPAGESLAY